jgi:hypothetical protein
VRKGAIRLAGRNNASRDPKATKIVRDSCRLLASEKIKQSFANGCDLLQMKGRSRGEEEGGARNPV